MITSAGVVLAAVFAVLGVLPLIVLTQLGIVVGLGILLDTFVVRTLLVGDEPRDIVFAHELPRTPTGKVLKGELRAQARAE